MVNRLPTISPNHLRLQVGFNIPNTVPIKHNNVVQPSNRKRMRPREDNKNRTKIINPDEEEINARPSTTTSSVHLYDHMRSATGSSCMQIPSLVQLFVGCINRSHEYIKSFTFNHNARQSSSSSPLPFIEPSSHPPTVTRPYRHR